MSTYSQEAILKLKVDTSDVKKGVDAAIKEVARLRKAVVAVGKPDISTDFSAPTQVEKKARTQKSKPSETVDRSDSSLSAAGVKELKKTLTDLKKAIATNLKPDGSEKAKIDERTLPKRFAALKDAERLYKQLGSDQKDLQKRFQSIASDLAKVQKNFEARTGKKYDAPEISNDLSRVAQMKAMMAAKQNAPTKTAKSPYDTSNATFDKFAKSVEELVRAISNSNNSEKIDYSPTNRLQGKGSSRGFAAKSRDENHTQVVMSDAIGARLQSGNMLREDLVTMIHEIRHAMQNELERTGGEINYVLDAKTETEKALVDKVQKLYSSDARTQKREIDANIFSDRVVDSIADALGISFVNQNKAFNETIQVLNQLKKEYNEHRKALQSMSSGSKDYERQSILAADAASRLKGALVDLGRDAKGQPVVQKKLTDDNDASQDLADEISNDLREGLEPFNKAQKKLIDYVSKIESGATKNPKTDAMEKYLGIAREQKERLEVGESQVEDSAETIERLNQVIELLSSRLNVATDSAKTTINSIDELDGSIDAINEAMQKLGVVKDALSGLDIGDLEGFTKLEKQLKDAAEIGASIDVVAATRQLLKSIEDKLRSVADGDEIASANIDLSAFTKQIESKVQEMLQKSMSDAALGDLTIRLDDVKDSLQISVNNVTEDLKKQVSAIEIKGNLPDVDLSDLFVKVAKQITEAVSDYVNLLAKDIQNVFEGKDSSKISNSLNDVQGRLIESLCNSLKRLGDTIVPEISLDDLNNDLAQISKDIESKLVALAQNVRQSLSNTPTTIDVSSVNNALDNAVVGLTDVVEASENDLQKAFREASDKIVVPDFDLSALQENINGFATRLNKKINALYKTLPRVIANEIKNAGSTELDTSFLPEMMSEVSKKIADLVKESSERMLAEIANVSLETGDSDALKNLQAALLNLNSKVDNVFTNLLQSIDRIEVRLNTEVTERVSASFVELNSKTDEALTKLAKALSDVDLSDFDSNRKIDVQSFDLPKINIELPDLNEISGKISDAIKNGFKEIEIPAIELTILKENLASFQTRLSDKVNNQFKTLPKSVSDSLKGLDAGTISVEPVQEALNKATSAIDRQLGSLLKSIVDAVNNAKIDTNYSLDLSFVSNVKNIVTEAVENIRKSIASYEVPTDLNVDETLGRALGSVQDKVRETLNTLSQKLNSLEIAPVKDIKAPKLEKIELPSLEIETPSFDALSKKITTAIKAGLSTIEINPIELQGLQDNLDSFQNKLGEKLNKQFATLPKNITEAIKEPVFEDITLPKVDLKLPDLDNLVGKIASALDNGLKAVDLPAIELAGLQDNLIAFQNKLSEKLNKQFTTFPKIISDAIKSADAGDVDTSEIKAAVANAQKNLASVVAQSAQQLAKQVSTVDLSSQEVNIDLSDLGNLSEGLAVEIQAFALKFSKKAIASLTSSANKIKLGDLDLGRLDKAMVDHIQQVIINVEKQVARIAQPQTDLGNFEATLNKFNGALNSFANEAISQLGVVISKSVKEFKLPELDLNDVQESAKTLYMVVKSASSPIMAKLSNKIQSEIEKAASQELDVDSSKLLVKTLNTQTKKLMAQISASLVEISSKAIANLELPGVEIKGVQALVDKFNLKLSKFAENAAKALVASISELEDKFTLPEVNIGDKFDRISQSAEKGLESFSDKIATSFAKEMDSVKLPKGSLEASAKNLAVFDSKLKEYIKHQIESLVSSVEAQKGIDLTGIKLAVGNIEASFNALIKEHISQLVREVKEYKQVGNSDYIKASLDGMTAKLATVIENLISQAKMSIANHKGDFKDGVSVAMASIKESLSSYVHSAAQTLKGQIDATKLASTTGLSDLIKTIKNAIEQKASESAKLFVLSLDGAASDISEAKVDKIHKGLISSMEKALSTISADFMKAVVNVGTVTKEVDTTDRLAVALTDKIDRLIQMSVLALNSNKGSSVDFSDVSQSVTIDVEKALHKKAYEMIRSLHDEISSVTIPKKSFADIKNLMSEALKSSLTLNTDALKTAEGSASNTTVDNAKDIKDYLKAIQTAVSASIKQASTNVNTDLKLETADLEKVAQNLVNVLVKDSAKRLKSASIVSNEVQDLSAINQAMQIRLALHIQTVAKTVLKTPMDAPKDIATSAAIDIEKSMNALVFRTLAEYSNVLQEAKVKVSIGELNKQINANLNDFMIRGLTTMQSQLANEVILNDKIKAQAEKAMDALSLALVRVIRNLAEVADQMAERGFVEGDTGTTVKGRSRLIQEADANARADERARIAAEKEEAARIKAEKKAQKQAEAEAVKAKESSESQIYRDDVEQLSVGLSYATDLAEAIAPSISEALDLFSDLFNKIEDGDASLDDLQDSLSNISPPVMFVSALAGLGKIITMVAPAIDALQRLENVLQTTSKIKFSKVTDQLITMSKTIGTDLASTSEQFGQFASSVEGSALEDQALGIFESVSKYSAALGMSTESQERAFTALTQMASKNKIQMEELQGQLAESLPGAVNKAAKALGVTKAELYDMMKAGELTATEFLPALSRELESSAEAMSGFNAAPMSQQLAILNAQLTASFVEPLTPITNILQWILGHVIKITDATSLFSVVALTTIMSLVAGLVASGKALANNIALTTVLGKAWVGVRSAVTGTIAPLLAISAALSVVYQAYQAFTGQLSKSTETKSLDDLNDKLDSTLDKLQDLRKKIKPSLEIKGINVGGIQTNTDAVAELKDEYNELNVAQKLSAGVAAAADRLFNFKKKDRGETDFSNFKNEAQETFVEKALIAQNKEREKAFEKSKKIVEVYDEMLGLSTGIVSKEKDAYRAVLDKESALSKQEAYYKSIESYANTIFSGAGSDSEKMQEFLQTLNTLNSGTKGVTLVDPAQLTDANTAMMLLKDNQADILRQRDEAKDEKALFDPDVAKDVIESLKIQLSTLEKGTKEYKATEGLLKQQYRALAEINAMQQKNLSTTKAFREAYADMINQRADNEFTSELTPDLAELDLYNRALASGATDVNDLALEKRKIESASHHMRLKQLREEAKTMSNVAMKVDPETLQTIAEITGKKEIALKGKLDMSLLDDGDIEKLLSDDAAEKLNEPLREFIGEYQETRQSNVKEQVEELLAQKELMFDIRSDYAAFEEQSQQDLADYAQQQNDAVKGYNDTVQSTIDNMQDVIQGLNRSLEDVVLESKKLKITNDRNALGNDIKRLMTASTGSLMSSLAEAVDRALGIQAEEMTGQIELTEEANQIKRQFDDGVSGIKSAFDDYISAFADFQKQLADIALERQKAEAEAAKERAKYQAAMNPTQMDASLFDDRSADDLVNLSEKMLSGQEYGFKASQEQVAESRKIGEKVSEQKAEAAKANDKLTQTNTHLDVLPEEIASSLSNTIGLAGQTGMNPMLVVLSEIKNAMIEGFNQLITNGLANGGPGGPAVSKKADGSLMDLEQSMEYAAKQTADANSMRDKNIELQAKAMRDFANATSDDEKALASANFADANRGIARAEKGVADLQTFLMKLGKTKEAASLNIGESAVRSAISDEFITMTSKYGQGTFKAGDASSVKASEDSKEIKQVAATFGKKVSEYFMTNNGYEKYQDGQVRDPNNTFTQQGSKMVQTLASAIETATQPETAETAGVSQEVVKVRDEALAKQTELQNKQNVNLAENARGKQINIEGQTIDAKLANDALLLEKRKAAEAMVTAFNEQLAETRLSPRDKAIREASSDNTSLAENLNNQRSAIDQIVAGLKINELTAKLKEARLGGNSEAIANAEALLAEAEGVGKTYRELDTQLQLEIDSNEQIRQAKEAYAAKLFDAKLAAGMKYGDRQETIANRLDDKYVNQDQMNSLKREEVTNRQAMENPAKLDELRTSYLELGFEAETAGIKAEAALNRMNNAELDALEDSLDTVTSKLESTFGETIQSLFSIDPNQNIGDQLIGIVNSAMKTLQDYAAEKLSGFVMDLFFEKDGSKDSKPQANEVASEVADSLASEYQSTQMELVDAKNAVDDQVTEKRGENLTSNANKMAGYVGAAASVVSAVQSGKTGSIIGSVLGGIAGAFIGGPGGAMMGASLGGSIGGMFYDGGEVEDAMAKERLMSGKKPVLATLHVGEQVLSTKNRDAEAFRAMQQNGIWDTMKSATGFANGGMVGNSQISGAKSNLANMLTNNNNQKTSTQTNIFNIKATEATLVPKLGAQIESKKRNLLA